MSAEIGPHPNADELAAFDAGCLPAARGAAVETHVAGCASCCRRLEELPEDAFAALVRAYAGKADGGRTRPLRDGEPNAWVTPGPLVGHPRYRVLGALGRGGMGVVYKAVQQHMDRVVALKVIHPPLLACPDFVERFRREVKAVARLRHPNIVLAHDADEAGGLHFLVMEYVEGTSLDRVMATRGPLPAGEACEYVRQAALGLQHACEQGLVHRDVKPHNLMLTPQGQVKVVDFGLAHLARAEGAATPASSPPLLGTPDYTAPEQARDPSGVDVRADVYSLGCTLYFLLTGQPPFPGGTPLQKLLWHQERPPRPVTELRPDVPSALAALLGRMLAKDRTRRPATPGEVASELAPFAAAALEGTAKMAAPRRRAGRRWGVLLGALALLAVVTAAGLAAWSRGRKGTDAPPPQPPAAVSDLLGPEQITGLKTQARERALDWLRRTNVWGTGPGQLVPGTMATVDKWLPTVDGYQINLGSRLTKAGKPAMLAARLGDLYEFELRPEEEKAFGWPPNRRTLIPYCKVTQEERPRARPRVLLTGLHIDKADALPRGPRVTGKVSFQALGPVGPEPRVRLMYYPGKGKVRVTGMWYPRGGLGAQRGELTFDMPAVRQTSAGPDPLLVAFVDLASEEDGKITVESNTLALLLRPLRPASAPKGKQ